MARKDLESTTVWLRPARKSDYNAFLLARRLGVSPRQLQRYTREFFKRSPQRWLDESRLVLAANKLAGGETIKKSCR